MRKCKVMVPEGTDETKKSMMLFKKEWTEIWINSEKEVHTEKGDYFVVNAELLGLSSGNGIVVLNGGILFKVPIHCIQLTDSLNYT